MQETANFKLKKPDYTDVADIADINDNTDIIDENLGRVTAPTYTDTDNNKYADIDGMHIRTDNAIYAKGGIKIVSVDPCTAGDNLTEDMVTGSKSTLYVLAKIDGDGDAVFKQIKASDIDVGNITADMVAVGGTTLQELVLHFSRAKGALYADNSDNIPSDGSRKFILGVFKDTPSVDTNLMPTVLPDAGIRTRVESDANGNNTYIDVYGERIVGRTDNASLEFPIVKADTFKLGANDITSLLQALKDGTLSFDKLTGTLPIAKGGTGATTAAAARTALGLRTASVCNIVQNLDTPADDEIPTTDAVDAALYKKADANHTHKLSDETITGTLPITKGGTGAITATAARTALGLGSASTKAYTTSVTSGGTSLPTSGAVYSAIEEAVENLSSRTHIVIAAYNTQNPLKANADYTCTSSNATEVIKQALSDIAAGGKIEFLDGTYNLQYSEDEIDINKDNVTIEGSGWSTIINQPYDSSMGEAKPAFKLTASNTHIKNMMICSSNVNSPVEIIRQESNGSFYENLFFICNGASVDDGISECIKGTGNCNYTRIINCRVYRYLNDASYSNVMFNFYEADSFNGIIGGNISSGYNNISLKVKDQNTCNNLAIYGHTAIDVYADGTKV